MKFCRLTSRLVVLVAVSAAAQERLHPKPAWEINLSHFDAQKPGRYFGVNLPDVLRSVAFGKRTTLIVFGGKTRLPEPVNGNLVWQSTPIYGLLLDSDTGSVKQKKTWNCCIFPNFKAFATVGGNFIVFLEDGKTFNSALTLYGPTLEPIRQEVFRPLHEHEEWHPIMAPSGRTFLLTHTEDSQRPLYDFHVMDPDTWVERQSWRGNEWVYKISDDTMVGHRLERFGIPSETIEQSPTRHFTNGLFFRGGKDRIEVTNLKNELVFECQLSAKDEQLSTHIDNVSADGKRIVVRITARYSGHNWLHKAFVPQRYFVYVYEIPRKEPIFQLAIGPPTHPFETFLSQDGSMLAVAIGIKVMAYRLPQ